MAKAVHCLLHQSATSNLYELIQHQNEPKAADLGSGIVFLDMQDSTRTKYRTVSDSGTESFNHVGY